MNKNYFSFLLQQLGSKENVVRSILKAMKDKLPLEGLFTDIPVNICGYTVYVRGRVMNGIPKIGTMFIKK